MSETKELTSLFPKKPCLIQDCHRKTMSRGLCQGCYQRAQKLVSKGKTTWEELINMGLANEAFRVCHRGPSKFMEAYEKVGEDIRKLDPATGRAPGPFAHLPKSNTSKLMLSREPDPIVMSQVSDPNSFEPTPISDPNPADLPGQQIIQFSSSLSEGERKLRTVDSPEVVKARAEQDGPSGIRHEDIDHSLLGPIEDIPSDPTGDMGTRPRTEPVPSASIDHYSNEPEAPMGLGSVPLGIDSEKPVPEIENQFTEYVPPAPIPKPIISQAEKDRQDEIFRRGVGVRDEG